MVNLKKIKLERYRELERKILLKWYRTPAQLAYMIKGMKPNCWHCKGKERWYSHVWWECPKVIVFWEKVWGKRTSLCKVKLNIDADLIFMGVLGNNRISKQNQDTFKSMLLAAHAVIAYGWKENSKWTLERWNDYLYEFIQSDILDCLKQ
ncbi:hypothetical protein JRQ81_013112, partial [Phrynocephalus forsythii]